MDLLTALALISADKAIRKQERREQAWNEMQAYKNGKSNDIIDTTTKVVIVLIVLFLVFSCVTSL